MAQGSAFNNDTIELIRSIAIKNNLEPRIINAVVNNESGWNPLAVRYEPAFKYIVDAPKYAVMNHISKDTEERLQMFSYGLMQIMGGTARGLNYSENLLTLTNIAINLELGCHLMKTLLDRYKGNVNDAIAAYNAGSVRRTAEGNYVNQEYVNRFNAVFSSL